MKKKILTIVGARPQIIKAAALSRAIATSFSNELEEIIVHTGQHYDADMSQVFFDQMGIPAPNHQLNVGSGSHASQTAAMLEKLEAVILEEKPQAVLIYGDTNSTLAGALAASKLHIPVVHVEAGLRSFNKSMPEEVNRITADHVSSILFAPTKAAIENLRREGFGMESSIPCSADHPAVLHCGDIMLDNALYFQDKAKATSTVLKQHALAEGEFFLATIHRDSNTDESNRLSSMLHSLAQVAKKHGKKVVLPLHPRTSAAIRSSMDETTLKVMESDSLLMIPPVSYFDMIALESSAALIITDSGGVQKEAYFYRKPCVILRPQTEWVELVENGNARITDDSEEKLMSAVDYYMSGPDLSWPPIFGDGKAAEFICETLIRML